MIICSPQLGLSPESNLGGEVHDREMIKALDSLGVKTLIILPLGKKHPPLKHAKFYFLPTPFVYPPWLFNMLILPYLAFLYWRYRFNVLRIHSPRFVGFGALLFKLFVPQVKTVATFHHLENGSENIDHFLVKRFDVVTTVSQATRDELRLGLVVPNGVDEKYKFGHKNIKLVKQYNLQDKKVLLYLGQLIERKNIPFLFSVIKRLPKNYALMVCGDGPLRSKLEKVAPPNVIFTGRIEENDKVDYYNLADVFVYPSKKEGFGLSVAEAMACGKPVVASNTPIAEHAPLRVDYWLKKIKTPPVASKVRLSWEEVAKQFIDIVSK